MLEKNFTQGRRDLTEPSEFFTLLICMNLLNIHMHAYISYIDYIL